MDQTAELQLEQKSSALWQLGLALGGLVVLIAGYVFVGQPLIVAAYERNAPDFFNRLISNPNDVPIDYYLRRGRILISRLVLVYLAVVGCIAVFRSKRLRGIVYGYFQECDSPVSLAVFRIVTMLAIIFSADPIIIRTFAGLPEVLRVNPGLGGSFLGLFPFEPDVGWYAAWALRLVCLVGIFGVYSRTTCGLAAALALFVLGIPQCFGKVNHYHHLIWFATLLATSRSGDALSVDAIRSGTGNWKNRLAGPAPSRTYAVPIRIAWLLMGLAYFFPGFWKVWNCGYEWGLAENLQLHLYHKWAELDGWRPFFRIDHYPLLLSLSGLGTIVFELSFIFLIIYPRTRMLAAITGLLFHNMTNAFMAISFWNLQIFYLTFIPWNRFIRTPKGMGCVRREHIAQVVVAGAVIGILNIGFGFLHVGGDWPFSCYPTFAGFRTTVHQQIEIATVAKDGREEIIPLRVIHNRIPSERLAGIFNNVLNGENSRERKNKLNALTGVLVSFSDSPNRNETLRGYRVSRSVFPNDSIADSQKRVLLFEINPESK